MSVYYRVYTPLTALEVRLSEFKGPTHPRSTPSQDCLGVYAWCLTNLCLTFILLVLLKPVWATLSFLLVHEAQFNTLLQVNVLHSKAY